MCISAISLIDYAHHDEVKATLTIAKDANVVTITNGSFSAKRSTDT